MGAIFIAVHGELKLLWRGHGCKVIDTWMFRIYQRTHVPLSFCCWWEPFRVNTMSGTTEQCNTGRQPVDKKSQADCSVLVLASSRCDPTLGVSGKRCRYRYCHCVPAPGN